MAEAIHHARTTWKVDIIIIIPSGSTSPGRKLEDAVEKARHAGIPIFAAAANHGNLDEVAFPGRLYRHLKLLCMFSTDPNVRAFPKFNPSQGSMANSFAILGENGTLPWSYHNGQQRAKTGTSYATMIGGAIAGRILDFSWHKDIRGKLREVHRLRSVEGMSAVYKKMVAGTDNGYECMAPWKLLPRECRHEEPKVRRMEERDYIRETISRALEKV